MGEKQQRSWGKALVGLFIEQDATAPSNGDDGPVDIDALLAEAKGLGVSTDMVEGDTSYATTDVGVQVAQATIPTPLVGSPGIIEGRPFSDFYGSVPKSPKPVEAILTFLYGLKKMPPEVQQAALAAMDDSDASTSGAWVCLSR